MMASVVVIGKSISNKFLESVKKEASKACEYGKCKASLSASVRKSDEEEGCVGGAVQ